MSELSNKEIEEPKIFKVKKPEILIKKEEPVIVIA